MKTRQEAFSLLSEYTKSASLIKHALAVEASMRWYAKHFGCSPEECETWGITGLLHDFDYEMYPTSNPLDGHPYKGNRILEERGYSEEVRRAIMGHAAYTGVPRDSQMAKTLFAVDELTGMITASTLVRPDKSLFTLEASSIKKKMKDKQFARGCNRDDMRQGPEELGIDFDQHVSNVILAMRDIADALELRGSSTAA